MINSSLLAFTSTLIQAGRIRASDVHHLQRDLLPDGISLRGEAELLLRLDQSVSRADPAFSAWLVAAMVDFVVWGTCPTGSVDRETAEWLVSVLRGSQGPTRTARLIADEIVREAQDVDQGLLAFMCGRSGEGRPSAPSSVGLANTRPEPGLIRMSLVRQKLRGGQRPFRRGLPVQEHPTRAPSRDPSRSRALARSTPAARPR